MTSASGQNGVRMTEFTLLSETTQKLAKYMKQLLLNHWTPENENCGTDEAYDCPSSLTGGKGTTAQGVVPLVEPAVSLT